MGQQAKVEASYASTHMTRRNYKGGPPLSRVNGVKLDKNSRKEENPNPKPKVKPEPGTDDEPEGSTDEDEVAANEISDDDMCDYRGDKGRTRPSGTTLQEKIEAGDAAERERVKMPLRSSQRDYGKSNGQTKSRKRAHDSIDVSSDEELFPSVSQSSKRHKARTYGSKPALNPPKSSMSESVEPMSIANSQDNTKAEEDPTEEKEEGFKFPMEIDLGSPPPRTKSRSKIKSEHDVKLNGSCKSKPRAFPNDTISSSSLAASSNNQWLIETDDSELSTPLSSCPSSFELELSRVDEGLNSAEKSKSELAQSLCPVCNEEVDPELLEAFLEKPRRRVRDQLQFCDSHQRTTAKKQWQAEGFPIIDWDNFEQRIQGHFDDLEKLLVPDSPSFYHNVLVDALKSGKARNFRLTLAGDGLETISCGYYGTRGSTKMYVVFFLFNAFL